MHLLVLENGEDRFAPVEQGMPGPLDVGMLQRVNDEPVRLCGECPDDLARRPLVLGARRVRSGRRRFRRIDASGKQALQAGVDARAAKGLLDQRVEAEAWQVAFVEHDGMAQRNRLAVVRLVCQHREQFVRPRAVPAVAVHDVRT